MINCIIVDDEPHCIESLTTFIQQIPQKMRLLQSFHDAEQALEFLKDHPVDLIFSDIQMNNMTGLELAEKVNGAAKIIFTTAHNAFGAESYNYNAVDFLQKPFDFERFKKAINKIPTMTVNANGTFFVREGSKKVGLNVNEVTYIDATGGYVKIHTKNRKDAILSLNSLGDFEKHLKPFDFFRIHNSHLVHLPYIFSYDVNYVEISHGNEIKMLPISNGYRNEFLKAMPVLGK